MDWLLPRDPSGASAARRHVGSLLAGVPPETRDDTRLLVTEVFSNAVRYGSGPDVHVRASLAAGHLWVGLADDAPDTPLVRPIEPWALTTRGRGMAIVQALATEWGVDEHVDDGKTVWFTVTW